MLGLLRRRQPSCDVPENREDGLYVKVGIPHSDPAHYWACRTVRDMGVAYLIPEDKRRTHELRIMLKRKPECHHLMVIFADLVPRARGQFNWQKHGLFTKCIAFDECSPGATEPLGGGELRYRREFLEGVVRALHSETEWRQHVIGSVCEPISYYGEQA